MATKKNRKKKAEEYQNKFGSIPTDYVERLEYMYDNYGFETHPEKIQELYYKKLNMMTNLQYYDLDIVSLYEIPEGASRPKYRLINRKNFHVEAMNNGQFVHVYVPNAKDDNVYIRRRLDNGELMYLDGLINTPVMIDYYAYLPTPSAYNNIDKVLAEIGLIRPDMKKPDWDNLGKKYCDMYNSNVWLDDATVNDGSVHKYFSILPRIEIKLRYLNCVYNKIQYNNIINRVNYDGSGVPYLDNRGNLIASLNDIIQ